MDQLKNILAVLFKHRFWVICGVVAIISGGTWIAASGNVKDREKTHRSAITGAKGRAEGIPKTGVDTSGRKIHPNKTTAEGMAALIEAKKRDVARAWDRQYEKQRAVFVWPAEVMVEGFEEQVKDMTPIETAIVNRDILQDYREGYKQFLSGHLPKLAEVVGAQWDGGPANPNVIVNWNPANQRQIKDRLTVFQSSGGVPTTAEMLYAQEDLWVVKSLLEIIKATNGNVDGHWQAKIKEIHHLRIGSDASAATGGVSASGFVGGGPGGGPGGSGSGADLGAPGGSGGGGGGGGGRKKKNEDLYDPAEGRYVDQDFNPIPASKLRKSHLVAKRMPVRIGLKMDQTALDDLLVNCSQSPLPVEVRWVRINKHQSGRGSGGGRNRGGGGGPAAPGAQGAEAGGGQFAGAGGGPGGGGGRRRGKSEANKYPFDLPVEIYGIIYIYNPVDEVTLAVEGDDKDTEGKESEQDPAAADPAAADPAAASPAAVDAEKQPGGAPAGP